MPTSERAQQLQPRPRHLGAMLADSLPRTPAVRIAGGRIMGAVLPDGVRIFRDRLYRARTIAP